MSRLMPWRGPSRRGGDLTRLSRDPFDALINQLFGGFLARPFEDMPDVFRAWDFDIEDRGNEYVVRAELPGFDERDLDVQVSDDVITIRAEKRQEGQGARASRRFSESVVLPPGVDADQIRADYRNGVLELHIPKPEQRQGRRIAIGGGQPAEGRQAAQVGQTAGAGAQAAAPAGAGTESARAAGKTGQRETATPGGKT